MAKIVDLNEYRTHQAEARCYGLWQKRFGEGYGLRTRLVDLSDRVVAYLATPGDDSNAAFYDLIMGALGFEAPAGFYDLGNEERLAVVDIHLFLADQIRFEMMRRLGWLKISAAADIALVDLIRDFERFKRELRNQPPELIESHPEYPAFKQLPVRDREVFVRQMLRGALEVFAKGLK